MRTAHVFVFVGGQVSVISDPALAIIRNNEWTRQGRIFWSVEVPYEDDKLRPSQQPVFGPSGRSMVSLHQRELG